MLAVRNWPKDSVDLLFIDVPVSVLTQFAIGALEPFCGSLIAFELPVEPSGPSINWSVLVKENFGERTTSLDLLSIQLDMYRISLGTFTEKLWCGFTSLPAGCTAGSKPGKRKRQLRIRRDV